MAADQHTAANGYVNGARAVRLTIPAKPEYITLCRLALTGLSRLRPLPDETVADLKLALTEACTNSIRHAYEDEDGIVQIVYELSGDTLAIEVSDDGRGFDHEPRERDDDDLSEGGLGIAIIQAIADEFDLGPGLDGRGSRLRFAKRLEA